MSVDPTFGALPTHRHDDPRRDSPAVVALGVAVQVARRAQLLGLSSRGYELRPNSIAPETASTALDAAANNFAGSFHNISLDRTEPEQFMYPPAKPSV